MGGSLALDFSDISTSQWPLIGYLYQDEVYKAQYDSYVEEVIAGSFDSSSIQSQYAAYATLIEPYATSEVSGYTFLNNGSDFQTAVNQLNAHVISRTTAVNRYLNE